MIFYGEKSKVINELSSSTPLTGNFVKQQHCQETTRELANNECSQMVTVQQ